MRVTNGNSKARESGTTVHSYLTGSCMRKSLETLQVILEIIFPVNLLTGEKHPAFSTNHFKMLILTKLSITINTKKPKQSYD